MYENNVFLKPVCYESKLDCGILIKTDIAVNNMEYNFICNCPQ